ncbi:hypothetical protein [Lysinibacillus sphaericus]|uniref:hypothetical protein n=1 Tax=Lysinibacillus sphaericus TaxID=1421 RepID=UPI0018CF37F6|nr:hypothetical protein [Lysinibacillus sphaericus]
MTIQKLHLQLLDVSNNWGAVQSWVGLVDKDAGLDAVYIHTPNPNDDNFPLKLENIKWDCPIPKEYKDLINLNEFNVGLYTGESNNVLIIQSKNSGVRV